MLPKTLAFKFVALFFGIAVAQQSTPPPKCLDQCCVKYLDPKSDATKAILGSRTKLPDGTWATGCTLGECSTADVGRKTSCCLYYAQYLGYAAGCDAKPSAS